MTKEATKIDTDKAPADVASGNETYVNMQDANVAENGTTETGDNLVQMEIDTKVGIIKHMLQFICGFRIYM